MAFQVWCCCAFLESWRRGYAPAGSSFPVQCSVHPSCLSSAANGSPVQARGELKATTSCSAPLHTAPVSGTTRLQTHQPALSMSSYCSAGTAGGLLPCLTVCCRCHGCGAACKAGVPVKLGSAAHCSDSSTFSPLHCCWVDCFSTQAASYTAAVLLTRLSVCCRLPSTRHCLP